MKIVYGTGNPAKLSGMKKTLEGLDLELVGIQETGILLPKAEETGSTPSGKCQNKGTFIL